METLSRAVGWANFMLAWAWVLWFGIGIVVGGIMLAHDEWRLHRTKPKLHEVHAYAEQLIFQHGREAFRINGDAMVAARDAKEFDRFRFLKEVSGELVSVLFGDHAEGSSSALPSDASTLVCFPGASPGRSEEPRAKTPAS